MMLVVILLVAACVVFGVGLRVVHQHQRALQFRLGKYIAARGPGLIWIVPLVDRVTYVDMRVQTETIEQPEAMSGDSVPVKVSAVVRYRIARPDRAVIEVKDVRNSVVETAQTSLRNLIGQNSVDALFKDQDKFLGALKKRIDDTTTPWGIEFQSIEIKNIEIPQGVQASMKQQADAEREKGASLDRAAAELEIARKLRAASDEIMKSPAALELRRMQMLTEIGADRNTTTIVMLPSEFIGAADTIAKIGARLSKPEPTPQSAPRDDSKSD